MIFHSYVNVYQRVNVIKEEWLSQWFSRSPVAGLGRPRTDGCGRETMTCHGYTIRINYEKPWKLVICCHDIQWYTYWGSWDFSIWWLWCIYVRIYIYIYISYDHYMLWFFKYEWEYDVVPCRNETHDEYHAPNIKTPQAYGPSNTCKHGFWGCWIFVGLDLSHIHEPGLTLITCLL